MGNDFPIVQSPPSKQFLAVQAIGIQNNIHKITNI